MSQNATSRLTSAATLAKLAFLTIPAIINLMEMKGVALTESLKKIVAGDGLAVLVNLARQEAAAEPRSAWAYARMRALEELASYFSDDQGIPTEEAQAINALFCGPIATLIDGEGLRKQSADTEDALSDFLVALTKIR
jgi:hypothetical protein